MTNIDTSAREPGPVRPSLSSQRALASILGGHDMTRDEADRRYTFLARENGWLPNGVFPLTSLATRREAAERILQSGYPEREAVARLINPLWSTDTPVTHWHPVTVGQHTSGAHFVMIADRFVGMGAGEYGRAKCEALATELRESPEKTDAVYKMFA